MPKTAPKAAAKPAPKPVAAKSLAKGDHVFLVDGSSYIFRAYHALPPLNRKSDGLQVNAVLGFCNMLWKLLRDMPDDNRPASDFDRLPQVLLEIRIRLPHQRRTGRNLFVQK